MIVTNGWDVLLIHFRYYEGAWEVRVGAGCLVILAWLTIRFVRWINQRDQAGTTT